MKARIHDFGKIVGRSRVVLLVGFGVLLGLLLLLGADAIDAVSTMQVTNASIQCQYLASGAVLSHIRSDFYLAGTYVRDYMTEPDPLRAERAVEDVVKVRDRMQVAVREYGAMSPHPSLASHLQKEVDEYWRIVTPVLQWSPEQRRLTGYTFLREQVFPRRTALLQISEKIAQMNVKRLSQGNERVLELFQGFRKRLIILLCTCVTVGLLVAGFATRQILRLERDAAKRYDEMAAARSELQDLSARLLQAQEDERRTISRELHDEVGQSLSALLVGFSNLTAAVPDLYRDHVAEQISHLRTLAETSVAAVRNTCMLLRPSMLDDLGLVAALQWHAREITRHKGILVSIASDEINNETLSDEHKTCIYRVTQEALNNACRHASPQNIRVTVRRQKSAISITVQDDGCGFRPLHDRGLGMIGMQERVQRLGGSFSVASEERQGSTIAVTLPLALADADAANS